MVRDCLPWSDLTDNKNKDDYNILIPEIIMSPSEGLVNNGTKIYSLSLNIYFFMPSKTRLL